MPRALAVASFLCLAVACARPVAGPAPTPVGVSSIVVPTATSNGRIEIRLQPSYKLGTSARVPVSVIVTRGTITGPQRASIYASGIGQEGRPSEVLVRTIDVPSVTVGAGLQRTVTVSWDGDDEHGALVPSDAYVLVLDFRIDDGGATTVRATATLQMND